MTPGPAFSRQALGGAGGASLAPTLRARCGGVQGARKSLRLACGCACGRERRRKASLTLPAAAQGRRDAP